MDVASVLRSRRADPREGTASDVAMHHLVGQPIACQEAIPFPRMNDPSSLSSVGFAAGVGVVEIYQTAPPPAERSHACACTAGRSSSSGIAGVNYARFAMRGSVTVTIEVATRSRATSCSPKNASCRRPSAANPDARNLLPPASSCGSTSSNCCSSCRSARSRHARRRLARRLRCNRPRRRPEPVARQTALQAAIDRAATRGRRHGASPRGLYRTGTLTLRSNVTLYLAPGSLLQGSSDPATIRSTRVATRVRAMRASRRTSAISVGR